MLKYILAASFIALPALSHAQAAPRCADRDVIVKRLAEKFVERQVAVGVTANGKMVEVLASPEGNTWSIVLTEPGGPSCFVAAGANWVAVAAKQTEVRPDVPSFTLP
jgi:hypothetical protein